MKILKKFLVKNIKLVLIAFVFLAIGYFVHFGQEKAVYYSTSYPVVTTEPVRTDTQIYYSSKLNLRDKTNGVFMGAERYPDDILTVKDKELVDIKCFREYETYHPDAIIDNEFLNTIKSEIELQYADTILSANLCADETSRFFHFYVANRGKNSVGYLLRQVKPSTGTGYNYPRLYDLRKLLSDCGYEG